MRRNTKALAGIALSGVLLTACGGANQPTDQSVLIQKSEKIVEYFNKNDSKSMHKMYSIEMKQAIPLTQ